MKYTKLGYTDIEVSKICLGTMTWGSQNTQKDAFGQMNYALSRGVNFWDTAEVYPVPPNAKTKHLTESYIGDYFHVNRNRDKVILATKVKGIGMPHIRQGSKLSPADIDIALEDSLTRLKTDYIDLYQLHWPNRSVYHFGNNSVTYHNNHPEQLREEHLAILECLAKHVKAGKIRHIGLSNDTAWGIMTYLELSRTHNLPRIVSLQHEYSLLCRNFEQELHEIAVTEKTGLLAWSPLVCGAISGKYLDGNMPAKSRKTYQGFRTFRDTPQAERAIRAYIEVAQKHNLDVCQMALAYILSRPFTTSAIIGATTMEQLENNIDACHITLSPDIFNDIEKVYRDNAWTY